MFATSNEVYTVVYIDHSYEMLRTRVSHRFAVTEMISTELGAFHANQPK